MTEKMRLAVPSNGEGGLEAERSGHFGQCDCFTIIDVADGQVADVQIVDNPPHEHGGCLRPVQLLAGHDVTALIVAGMGARPLAGFNDAGIEVYFDNVTPGVGDVVALLGNGGLPKMDSRNVCGGH